MERKDTVEFALYAFEHFHLAHVLGDGVVVAVVNDSEGGETDGKE